MSICHNISSNNQSGGATAHAVNLYPVVGERRNKVAVKWSLKNVFWFLGGLASLVSVLGYFGLQPGGWLMGRGDKTINVTSFNQSGGITADTVNVGQQPRQMTPQLQNQLLAYLNENPGKKIDITAVMGDQEAFQFAHNIKTFLQNKGYTPEGVAQAIFSQPVKGQVLEPAKGNGPIKIIIGTR